VRRLGREISVVRWKGQLWRIQRSPEPDHKRYPSPRHRFDAAGGRYAAIYTNDDKVGTLGEVYVDRGRRLGRQEGKRHLVRITATSALRLVDLRSDETLSALDLDARISTGEDYEACQKWALALYEALPDIAGLRYAPRKAGEGCSNVVLFAERCAASLEYWAEGRLEELEDVVLAAVGRYRLRAAFLV
jgi:hypothetical protein